MAIAVASARSKTTTTAPSRARAPPPMSSLHDIDDLYENNAYQEEEDGHDEPFTTLQQRTTKAREPSHPATASGKPKATATAGASIKSNNKPSPSSQQQPQLDFDVWVARKDKYERVAQTLAKLNTDRANDDDKWLNVAVSLAATDVLLKTGKTDKCDCAGICRVPAHSVAKQRTKCQCPAKKCSLCKRCMGTSQGEITTKMAAALQPFRELNTSQSMVEVAQQMVTTGEGKSSFPGGPKISTAVVRMATTVLQQCSVLENSDGTKIQRPCSCPVKSLGDLWVKWTTKFHTFSRIPLQEQDALKFSSGTRQMMEFDEETRTFFMTLKWHQAAKPQKGDTAKIAARRMLTSDQKRQNGLFLSQCKSNWHKAQLQVVEQLETKMETFLSLPTRKMTKEEYEIAVLTNLGVKRMMKWLEEDQEAIDDAKNEEHKEKTDGGVVAHHAWVKRKDRLRIRMPDGPSQSSNIPGNTTAGKSIGKTLSKPPPRMDFSSGKGVVRAKTVQMPSSTVEIMQNSGLKYVHAMNEGFQGRGGDLEKCKHLLLKKGHILKANFDQTSGGGNGNDDDDGNTNPFSKDRYYFEKQNNPTLQNKKIAEQQRTIQSKDTYQAWIAHKAMKEKAVKFLQHIPKLQRDQGDQTTEEDEENYEDDYEDEDADRVPDRVKWVEVGKALKAVDRSLLDAWVQWSDGFASASQCRVHWEAFTPVACDVHCTSSAIRDVFLKLLHRKGVNYKDQFLAFCEKKHKKQVALGLEEEYDDDISEKDQLEKFAQMDKKEFSQFLKNCGIVLQMEEIQRVVEYFDTNGDQQISMKEFLQVVGDEKRSEKKCHGDIDVLLAQVCMWETVCHECGMLNAFQLVIGNTKPGEPRMRAELPGHRKRREKYGCTPECDMLQVKTNPQIPKTCIFSQWNDTKASPFLKKLEIWSAKQREQHVLEKMVTQGTPPDAPAFFKDDDDALDPTTSLLLKWQPPPIKGNNGTAFYVLETIGAEGTNSFRLNEYSEIYRDPKDYKDNGGVPRYHFVVTGLLPNTKYGFRVRALNGFGAGPFSFAYFLTSPATPPMPLAIKVTCNSITLGWESSNYYKRQLRELKQVFDEADVDKNGFISRDEFMDEIERRKPKLLDFLQKMTVPSGSSSTKAPMLSVFDAIETDDNETISWDEFKSFFHGYLVDNTADVLEASISSSSSSSTKSLGAKSASKHKSSSVESSSKSNKPISSCRYVLKQCTDDAKGEYVEIYRGQKPTFTVHGLASGSTYQFRVQAFNDDGCGSLHSDPLVVNTLLQTPSGLALVESACTCTSVKLKWPKATARACLSHEAKSAQTNKKGAAVSSTDDHVTRILKEWANETSVDDGSIDFKAKFDRYDLDKSGFIEIPEFKTLLEELGVSATPERMAAYLDLYDLNKDGKISFEEFTHWWTRTDVQYVVKRSNSKEAKEAASDQMSVVCYRGKETSAIISGLEPNCEYHFRMRTVSSHASSQLSEAIVVWTPPQAPSCAGLVTVLSTSAQICWYAGRNGAHKFIVECKFIETLPSMENGSTTARKKEALDGWLRVYEGNDRLATLADLIANTVYRVRVFSVNAMGLQSDQSTVTQFCTLLKDDEKKRGLSTLKPSNAADHFVVECCDEGDVVAGDTILFSERLLRTENGKVVGESELSRPVNSTSYANGTGGDRLTSASVYSTASYYSSGPSATVAAAAEPIGERTIAGRVLSVRPHEKYGNIVNMVVVWSTVQLYGDALGNHNNATTATRRVAAAGRASGSTSRVSRAVMNSSMHTTSHALTLNTGLTLAADTKIARKERALYRYDVFRKEWQDERARDPRTWDK